MGEWWRVRGRVQGVVGEWWVVGECWEFGEFSG